MGGVSAECREVSRRPPVPLCGLAERRARRLRYQDLYARVRGMDPAASRRRGDPRGWGLGLGPRRAAEPADAAALAAAEAALSLEEAAHFRAGVAAAHSPLLVRAPPSQGPGVRKLAHKVGLLIVVANVPLHAGVNVSCRRPPAPSREKHPWPP